MSAAPEQCSRATDLFADTFERIEGEDPIVAFAPGRGELQLGSGSRYLVIFNNGLCHLFYIVRRDS